MSIHDSNEVESSRSEEPTHTSTPTPAGLIRRASMLVPKQKALGRRLGISKSRICRIVHGARLGVANCLRLADLLNEDPAIVLRAYGYAPLGEILDRLHTLKGGAR